MQIQFHTPFPLKKRSISTKKLKYSLLKTFFNFIKNSIDQSISNPYDSPILKKTFKAAKGLPWTILDKDVVDEIIFKTDNLRNRLMLELMARGDMRIGEVLKLRANNVNDRKLFLSDPKSGRQSEMVFIPKKVADRLREYIASEKIKNDNRVFPLGYRNQNIAIIPHSLSLNSLKLIRQ